LIFILTLLKRLKLKALANFFGFIQGHNYLTKNDFLYLKKLIGFDFSNINDEFELEFSKIIGGGTSVSFASARMGFYVLMKSLNIGKGDEIILLGSTCSVMVNAVLRTGAIPIYTDIDINTFGSDINSIRKKITKRTKIIVAQHSFGIPCNILPIKRVAIEKKIFLLEDCALSIGSKFSQKNIGTFGDAALFSTDHSKPINTLIGGIIYTENKNLADKLKYFQTQCDNLSYQKQKSLFFRLKFESLFCNPDFYIFYNFFDKFYLLKNKIFKQLDPFLSDDSNSTFINSSYPYPAKLPSFLAYLGLIEISRWNKNMDSRKLFLKLLLGIFEGSKFKNLLPSAYFDDKYDIVPLRLVWSDPHSEYYKKNISKFINVSWFWFKKPIIGSKEDLVKLNYTSGMCKISEAIGINIINVPCNIDNIYFEYLLQKLTDSLTSKL
jgi:dTDP-4-amino-4,6-dideoxygalactose transaminase